MKPYFHSRGFVALTLLLFIALSQSCGSANQNAIDDSLKANATVEDSLLMDFTRSYAGSLGNKYGITMTLTKSGSNLSGTYAYDSHGIAIKISGTIDNNGNLTINEFNDKGNMTGIFKGQLSNSIILGNWMKPDGSGAMPFSVSESNMNESASGQAQTSSKKKDLLTRLVGAHYLESISGFMGANTMIDYSLVNGKWTAGGSMLSNGQREGYDIELSKKDLQKLNSMKIIVSPDLSVSVECDGKNYFTAPYKESGMEFLLKGSPEDYGSSMPSKLQATTTFLEGNLFLYAKDNVPSAEIEPIDIVEVMADVVVLKYNEKDEQFELSLDVGEYGGSSTYMFK